MQRIIYSFLDYLGDIGGLYGSFNGMASVVSLLLNFNGVYHLLTSSLFRVETKIVPSINSADKRKSVFVHSDTAAKSLDIFAGRLGGMLNKISSKANSISEFEKVN